LIVRLFKLCIHLIFEEGTMRIQRITKAGIIILTATLLIMPLAALAGNLEPTAPPTTGTMRTLDDIYNKTNNATALPKPEEVTIITKTHGGPVATIHTVMAGKTFYLMGVYTTNNSVSFSAYLYSFDGTNNIKILSLGGADHAAPPQLVSSYPIASFPSGTQVRGESNNCELTIWGYEK
jgi:hypothetical protein